MSTSTIPKSVKASLYIDGKPAVGSIKEIEQETQKLQRKLRELTVGTTEWNNTMRQVGENRRYLADVRQEMNGMGGAFARIRQELGALGTMAAGYLGFQFITSQFQNIVAGNAKLSDSLADIRRVTGLTEEAVLNLDSSLGKLDTRTSKSGLRDMAVIAGKLGVAKTGILDFVEATDKLVVSLGDELGNADEVTTQLGKILNVFEGNVNADNISRLGNAMVGLANAGVASGGFIAAFTQQVSGVAKAANVSVPATLALGAGLEELGGRAESSATAVQKILVSISSDLPKAASIAGLPLKEFTTLFADKPEQALLKYTAGLVKNKKAFSEVSASVKDAGEDGARVVTAIMALGQKTDFFNSKIALTSKLYQETGELTSAFALKNESLGGMLDKLGKDFNRLSANTTLVDMLTKLVIATSDFVGWIDRNIEAIKNITKVLVIAGVAWGVYRLAVFFANAEKKAWIKTLISAEVLENLAIARTALWGVVTATLTGNFKKAAQELKLLGLMMNLTPWGVVLGAVAALGTAFYLYSGKLSTSARIQGDFNDVQAETKKRYEAETETLHRLDKIRTDANSTLQQKAAAIKKINELYPSILSGLTAEEALTNKGTDAIKKYLVELDKKINAEVALDKIKQLKAENLDLSASDGKKGGMVNEAFQSFYGAIGADSQVKRLRGYNKADDSDEITANNVRISELQKQYGAAITANDLGGDTPTGGGGGGKTETDAERKKREAAEKAANDKIIADKKKLQDDLNKIAEDVFNKQLSDQYREIAQTRNKYDQLALLAHGDADLLAKLEIQQQEELIEISKKYAEKAKEETKKQFAEKLKQIKEFDKLKEDLYRSNELQKIDNDSSLNLDQKSQKKESFTKTATAGDAYETAWQQLYAFHEAKIITDAEFADTERQLQEKLANDIAGIRTKGAKASQQEINDFIIGSTQLVADTVFTIMGNSARAASDAKIDGINSEREKELAQKNLSEAQKKKINDKYDVQIRQEKRRAWEAEQRASIAQAVINSALAVTAALTNPYAAALVIPMIISTTAAQIAVIAAQPVPKFAKGGFNEPAGFTQGETLYSSASGNPFIAGEAGREWIAPNWMVTDPRTANIINTLETIRQNRSFAMGGFTNAPTNSTLPLADMVGKSSTSNTDLAEMKDLFRQMIDAQNKANNKKVTLVYQDFEKFAAETVEVRNSVTG